MGSRVQKTTSRNRNSVARSAAPTTRMTTRQQTRNALRLAEQQSQEAGLEEDATMTASELDFYATLMCDQVWRAFVDPLRRTSSDTPLVSSQGRLYIDAKAFRDSANATPEPRGPEAPETPETPRLIVKLKVRVRGG